MKIHYSIKRCHSFGFSRTVDGAKKLAEQCFPNVTMITCDSPSLDAINGTGKGTVIVELARRQQVKTLVPYSSLKRKKQAVDSNGNPVYDTDGYPVYKEEIADVEDFIKPARTEHYSEEFCNALCMIIDNPGILKDDDRLSSDMLQYIIEVYPLIRDVRTRNILLGVLNKNNYGTLKLEKKYPHEMVEKVKDTVVQSELFSDIVISVGTESDKQKIYRNADDKHSSMSKSAQLDAFSENRFVVIRNRHSACIQCRNNNQNHNVLDYQAINGVLRSPELNFKSSMETLVDKLEQYDEFDVIFVHPSLEADKMLSEVPSEFIIPTHTIGEGEILAVAFWYIVKKFFGYCSVDDENQESPKYII